MLLRTFAKNISRSPKVNLGLFDKNICAFGVIKKFKLPDLGEKIKEATIKKWYVKEGDMVEEYQTLADVATDKLFTPIPSSETGRIHKRYFLEEENCEVGQVLLEIEVEESGATTSAPQAGKQEVETKSTGSATTQQATKSTQGVSKASPASGSQSHATFATPAVRALAKEHNIDLKTVQGTGKAGRIMKEDVLSYVRGEKPAATKATTTTTQAAGANLAAGISKNVVNMNDFQKGMQKSMTEATTIPHFYYKDDFDVTDLNEFREKMKKQGVKLTFMPFMIKSASLALSKYPIINTWYNKDKPFEYTQVDNHNISFAIDSPKGLVVPNIKNVQNLSILEVNEEFNRIIASAQAGTLGYKDLSEGTFTISNIGNIGGTYLGPVILAPQVAIVAVGKTQVLPRYITDEKGQLVLGPRRIMNVSFGCDHRVLDGATVARFAVEWKKYLEDPQSMLLKLR